jgi:hypothetical protein
VGVLAVFIAYTALSDGYEDPLTSEGQIILATIATMAAVGVLAPLVLRGAMLSSRDPNVSFPNKPAPIPGMPRPFKRDASGAIIPAGPPPGAARSPDGWVTVQLLTMPLPPECSVCLKETDRVATFNKSDLVQVPLRICPDCYAACKRTRTSWIVGGIGALALPALVIAMMLPEVDLAGQIITTVIAAVVGGIAGAIIGNGRGAPAKFGAFDSTLNTLCIRFRNPAYADVFLRQQEENDADAATMSSSPQLAH